MDKDTAELIRRHAEIEVEIARLAKEIKERAGSLLDERKGLKEEARAIVRTLRGEANKQLPLNLDAQEVR